MNTTEGPGPTGHISIPLANTVLRNDLSQCASCPLEDIIAMARITLALQPTRNVCQRSYNNFGKNISSAKVGTNIFENLGAVYERWGERERE